MPQANSTNGYLHEIGARQARHRPASMMYDSTGMLSYQRMAVPQRGQAEPGWAMLRPAGMRAMTTFRKLPTQSPKSAQNSTAIGGGIIIAAGAQFSR
jgi:hypothetical protein